MITSTLKNYIGSTAKQVAGSLGSSMMAAVNCDQGVLNTVLGKVNYLHQSIDRATSFINMFSLLNNEIPTDVNVRVDVNTNIRSDVEYARQEIEDGLSFIKRNYGDKFTLTDASGLMYNLYLTENSWVEDGAVITSKIKTSARNTIADCLFYEKDGRLYLNQVLRTVNFSSIDALPGPQPTILANVEQFCLNNKRNYDGTMGSIPGSGTIVNRLQQLSGVDDDIITMARILNPVREAVYRGKVKLVWDVLRDYVQSSELNSVILETIQAISAGVDSVRVYISSVAVRINEAMSGVRKFFIDLSNAFAQGGFKGVVYFIYNFFRAGSTMTDSDGLLSFTDNSLLVPKQYIAGLVPVIVTTATALASVIASFISPIVGAIFAGVGSIMYGAFKSVQYDADATRCGIQTSDKVLVPAHPCAIWQDTFTPTSEMLNLLNDYPILLFEVPGGYIVVGPGSFDADNNVTAARCEFHPSCAQKLPLNYFDDIFSNCTSQYSDVDTETYSVHIQFSTSSAKASSLATDWGRGSVGINITNTSNDRVNDYSDYLLTQLFCFNTFCFLYWTATRYYGDGHVFMGDYDLKYHFPLTRDQAHPFESLENYVHSYNENWEKLLILMTPYENAQHSGYIDGEYRTLKFRAISACSWANIIDKVSGYAANNVNVGLYPLLVFGNDGVNRYYGDPIIVPNTFDWAIVTPKYDASTFLTWIVVTTLAIAVTAVVTVIATFKIRKAIQNKRADMNRKVDKAWADYTKGDIDYNEYRKTVKQANRWQTIIGGTRYDYENYWNGDQSISDANQTLSDDPNTLSTVSTVCTDLINKVYKPEVSRTEDAGKISIEDIKMLIAGS